MAFDPIDPRQPTEKYLQGQNGPVLNPDYDAALDYWLHHGRYEHLPLQAKLHTIIEKQHPVPLHSAIKGKHPHGRIHVSLTPPHSNQGPKLLLFPGHLNVQPYSGQGTDAEIAFMQAILDFRDRNGLHVRQLYEIFAEGLGGFLVWWTNTLDQLLRPMPNPRTHPPTEYDRVWYAKYFDHMYEEGLHVHRPHN